MFAILLLALLGQDKAQDKILAGPCTLVAGCVCDSVKTVFVKGDSRFAVALRDYIPAKKFDRKGVRKSGTWMKLAATEAEADAVLEVTETRRDCGKVLAWGQCTVPFIILRKGDYGVWSGEPKGFMFRGVQRDVASPGPARMVKSAMSSLEVLCR